ncbi:MAG: TatD family hydrolase [Muribaculaceae bacterium]|nr:TatD family hydrolase [Muribaculaceae bacterium]
MIDTHSHPYLPEFEDGGEGAVDRAVAAGVSFIVLPNVDASSVEPMMHLHNLRPDTTAVALGLHPTEVNADWRVTVEEMERELKKGGFAAVGEVGMDLYWDKTFRQEQMAAFERQLRISEELSLPVIIHCREALKETLEVIDKVRPSVPLIFHSFTGTREDVREIRKICNPAFGINGVVTFKNAGSLREAIPEIGIDHIVLETDAPYLAPVPKRGKRNESSFLPFILCGVAEALGMTPEDVERATDSNARKLFNLS